MKNLSENFDLSAARKIHGSVRIVEHLRDEGALAVLRIETANGDKIITASRIASPGKKIEASLNLGDYSFPPGETVTRILGAMNFREASPTVMLKVQTPDGERIVKALRRGHVETAKIAASWEAAPEYRGIFGRELHLSIQRGSIHGWLKYELAEVEKFIEADGSSAQIKAFKKLAAAFRDSDRVPAEQIKAFAKLAGYSKSIYRPAPVEAEQPVNDSTPFDEAEYGVIFKAATNLNQLQHGAANPWHVEFHRKPFTEKAAALKPMLAAKPFPAAASPGERIFHIRQILLALAPAPVQAPSAPAPTQPLSFESEFAESRAIQAEFGSASVYAAFRRAQGHTPVSSEDAGPAEIEAMLRVGKFEQAWSSHSALRRAFPSARRSEGFRSLAAYCRNAGSLAEIVGLCRQGDAQGQPKRTAAAPDPLDALTKSGRVQPLAHPGMPVTGYRLNPRRK